MAIFDAFEISGRVYTVAYIVPAVVKVPKGISDEAILKDLYGRTDLKLQRWDAKGKATTDGDYVRVDFSRLITNFRRYFVQPPKLSAPQPRFVSPPLPAGVGIELDHAATEADLLRNLYNRSNQEIYRNSQLYLKQGRKLEDVARWVVRARNDLKIQIRQGGPALFRKLAELRNTYIKEYGNPVGPSYDFLRAKGRTDLEIIENVEKTSRIFNESGRFLRFLGTTAKAVSFVFAIGYDSPEALPPLPISEEESVECEITRLKLGIPPGINIDRHGHPKKNSYLQVDFSDLLHAEDELDQETDEILWWFGVPITYVYEGVTWTVPGSSWRAPKPLEPRGLGVAPVTTPPGAGQK